jgi:hypothetical protein
VGAFVPPSWVLLLEVHSDQTTYFPSEGRQSSDGILGKIGQAWHYLPGTVEEQEQWEFVAQVLLCTAKLENAAKDADADAGARLD